MPVPNPNEKILTYNEITLLRSDLQILRSPSFINDRLLHFYFSHLLSTSKNPRLLLLPPSISFFLSQFPNPNPNPNPNSLAEFAAPLSLHQHDLILFPVNNNDDPTLAEGGTHWSLLAYYRTGDVFVHYDSCDGMNRRHARRLYDAAKGFVGGDPGFVEGEMWRQRNGYDCGVFVMAAARRVCEWFEEGEGKWWRGLEGGEEMVAGLREEVLDLIFGLGGRE